MRVMPTPLKLSVLDQSPSAQDRTQDCAIRESLALARHCDALGYHRYWVSEHHDSASIVGRWWLLWALIEPPLLP